MGVYSNLTLQNFILISSRTESGMSIFEEILVRNDVLGFGVTQTWLKQGRLENHFEKKKGRVEK